MIARQMKLIASIAFLVVAVFGQKTTTDRIAVSGSDRTIPIGKARPAVVKASVKPRLIPAIPLLGSVATASAAESFAVNGNIAYTCDNNEISAINITNPANMQVVGTATAPLIQNSGDIHCSLQRSTLVVFSDQTSSTVGSSPGFVAFSLANPTQPSLVAATPINKRFFSEPLYVGNLAYVPTTALTFQFGWSNQFGDLLAVDVSNFSNPTLLGTLEQPQIDPVSGGPNDIIGVTQAGGSLLYIGISTSTGAANNGVGGMRTVDASNPAAMTVIGQLSIPGTIQSSAPLIQGTVGVSIGNNGGYVGAIGANPSSKGNIVITTFDVSDPRQPQILSINTTTNTVGPGGGATQIGPNLFAFAGVLDSNSNNVLLIVDVTNPAAPVMQTIPIPQPFTDMRAVGTTLFATLGPGGFAAYSIPGITNTPTSVCPVFIDTMLVLDRGANIPSQAFSNAEAALESFINSLHLPSDQVGVASFTTSGTVNQTLTNNASLADNAFSQIIPGSGASYIGSGIAAAQAELTSPRHNPSAAPMLIIVSDGADLGAPSPTATLAAANAAKAAGISIVSVQYGTGSSTLMQSIASSAANFYQVTQ